MKSAIVLLVALATAVSGFQYAEEFEAWKEKHGRFYESDEVELRRRITWESNMQFVKEHNAHADEIGFTVEMNKFADLEVSEFIELYAGLKVGQDDNSTLMPSDVELNQVKIPSSISWKSKGYVTSVKNQGSCGSCYSFSAIGALESAYGIKHSKKGSAIPDLSEQQVVDCSRSYGNLGCDGGRMTDVFRYIMAKGSQSESSYPYKATVQSCKYNPSKVKVHCSNYGTVRKDEAALQEVIAEYGPVSVGIHAGRSFQLYGNGVYDVPNCSKALNHAVLATGYGTENGKQYYEIKNSYGTGWGMDGYIWMSRNKNNQCGIANMASLPFAK